MTADAVLLATGHWFPESQRVNYFDSPWPAAKLLEGIPPGVPVAVIGTSLSAIETVLTLTSEGQFKGRAGGRITYVPSQQPRKITLYSRRGLLPKVRGKIGSYKNRYLNAHTLNLFRRRNENQIALTDTFQLLNLELENAYGRPIDWTQVTNPIDGPAESLIRYINEAENGDGPSGDIIWQTVLSQTYSSIKDWYAGLTHNDRQLFDRNYTSVFFTHAATQPHINASKLLALMDAKLVKVVKLGMNYELGWDHRQRCYRLTYMDSDGNPRTDTYEHIVDARGQRKSLQTNPSRLARNLIALGCVQMDPESQIKEKTRGSPDRGVSSHGPHGAGSIMIDPHNHRVLSFPSGASGVGTVYAVGAMTRGLIINTSMAAGIAMATATIAEDLILKVAPRSR
jgi:hypothetical protein